MKKRWFVTTLLVEVLAIGLTGGTVLAQENGTSSDSPVLESSPPRSRLSWGWSGGACQLLQYPSAERFGVSNPSACRSDLSSNRVARGVAW